MKESFGRGAQLECEQIYAKVLGANHGETLDSAMCAQTLVKEEGDSDEGEEEVQAGDCARRLLLKKRRKEIATKEKRSGKREIAEKDTLDAAMHAQTVGEEKEDEEGEGGAIGCTVESKYTKLFF